jgi:hypothetical protein
MNFFKNIIRIDPDLTPLVFAEINMEQFLQTNIIDADSGCIQVSCDFLKSFQ